MSYLPNIPQGPIPPATQVTEVKTNFNQYASVFDNNHIAMNLKGQGQHSTIVMENQPSDPGVSLSLSVLYNKNAVSASSPSPGQPQLFVQIPTFLPTSLDTTKASNSGMQLTYNSVGTAGPNQYYSFLPGGYILYFGITTGTLPITITLSPTPTKIIMANASPNNLTSTGTPSTPYVTIDILQSTKQVRIYSVSGPSLPGGYNFSWAVIAQS